MKKQRLTTALKTKKRRNNIFARAIKKSTELTHNSQVLLKHEQERNVILLEEPAQQKQNIWERICNRDKKVNMT